MIITDYFLNSISYMAFYIDFSAFLCYGGTMNTYFENQLTYNRITFQLSNKPDFTDREIHPYHELLFYINGNTLFLTEQARHRLHYNTLLIIPKETYHYFRLENTVPFLRLKISFYDQFLEQIPLTGLFDHLKILEKPDDRVLFVLNRLYQVLKEHSDEMAAFYAYSAFQMLLAELEYSDITEISEATEVSSFLTDVLDYISLNLPGNLNIAHISRNLGISPSSLTHRFTRELGIPLHEYITQRRLLLARKLIHEGNKSTAIYPDCGFRDYSSFYKAYLKYFGHSPSCEKCQNKSSQTLNPKKNKAKKL